MTHQPSSTHLSLKTQEALECALADEREAEDVYAAVLTRHGQVRPFSNIIQAERRHQQELLVLFERYGLTVPDRNPTNVEAPESLVEACRQAVDSETRNVAMFERLLKDIAEDDIRATFLRLQEASRDRHLPAFRRCMGRIRNPR